MEKSLPSLPGDRPPLLTLSLAGRGQGPGMSFVVAGLCHACGTVLVTGLWARSEALVRDACFSRKWKLYREKHVLCLICIFKA